MTRRDSCTGRRSLPGSADQYRLYCGFALAHDFLHGQRSAAPAAGRGAHGGAVLFVARVPVRCGIFSASFGTGKFSCGAREHDAAPLGAHRARGRRRDRAGGVDPVCHARGAAISHGVSGVARAACPIARRRLDLPQGLSRSRFADSQRPQRAGFHGGGRRRAEFAVLPLVRQNQCRRHHSLQLLHGFRALRRVPQGHLSSSGKARCTISHRSTISSTGNRSSTCRSVVGTRPSKWCAGCHDHAVFFNGRFDRPIKDQIDTPEAQSGPGMHFVPLDRTCEQHHGQRGFHD